MINTGHTEPPWETLHSSHPRRVYIVSSKNKTSIAATQIEADAAHIVKCVNCHDDLLEALKDISRALRSEHLRVPAYIDEAIAQAEDSQ